MERLHPDLVTHDEPPAFARELASCPFSISEDKSDQAMRWQSFHGHPGATMSGPATGVTGGIFLAGLLKRLTHRWTSTPLVPAKNWPCPAAHMVRLMEAIVRHYCQSAFRRSGTRSVFSYQEPAALL